MTAKALRGGSAFASFLRDVWIVTKFDLADAIRSRRVIVFLVLYGIGAIAAILVFTEFLHTAEATLSETLRVGVGSRPGGMTAQLMQTPTVVRSFERLFGKELAHTLLTIPPVALFYGWAATTFAPSLVVFTSGDAIAQEVSSGSLRFATVRTSRAAWAVGKYAGHFILIVVAILLGAALAWVTSAIRLMSFEGLLTAKWLLWFAFGACTYAFTWLGITLGMSQLVVSPQAARALGLLALVAMGGTYELITSKLIRVKSPVLFDTLAQIFPGAYKGELYRTSIGEILPNVIALVAIGVTVFCLGHIRLAKRDL